MENHEIIIKPAITEKIYDEIEFQNRIYFEVNKNANKYQIKRAVQELYNVRVLKVNTYITPLGVKRAICKLAAEDSASELATDLNLFG
jgi:ribosomal protein L23